MRWWRYGGDITIKMAINCNNVFCLNDENYKLQTFIACYWERKGDTNIRWEANELLFRRGS